MNLSEIFRTPFLLILTINSSSTYLDRDFGNFSKFSTFQANVPLFLNCLHHTESIAI